jgi:fermentation-respiration switch protein FrsA (DUF1100 family)
MMVKHRSTNTIKDIRIIPVMALIIVLSGCAGMFFYPQKELLRTPDKIGIQYEDVSFASSDGTHLHGWFLPARQQAKGTVVFFHGNAENISTHIGAVYWLPAEGYNVFLFDYRGYGLSAGHATIRGVHEDARAALQYVHDRADVDPQRLVLFGQSLGGAIAIYTAATAGIPLAAVVVESAFADYRKIMREKLADFFLTWPLQWPLSYTVTDRYSPLRVVADLKVPLLIIHGDADKVVPVEHAYDLYKAATGDKTLWIVKGGGHTAAFGANRLEYRPRLLSYLEKKLNPD